MLQPIVALLQPIVAWPIWPNMTTIYIYICERAPRRLGQVILSQVRRRLPSLCNMVTEQVRAGL
jgi:hypothetical protein